MKRDCLTQIRIVEIDQLLTFEDPPTGDQGSDDWSDEARVVRHPLLVTPLDDNGYLFLDDQGYLDSLTRAGLRQLPVQVCRPDQLTLTGADLGLVRIRLDDILRIVSRYPDQMTVLDRSSSDPVYVDVDFQFEPDGRAVVRVRHSKRRGCPKGIRSLLRDIARIGRLYPVSDLATHPLSENSFTVPVSGRMHVPGFSLDDLRAAALTDDLFPYGIVDISPSFRVLEIDFPISVLSSDISVREKEMFLWDLMLLRQQARRTATFDGPVFLLNRP